MDPTTKIKSAPGSVSGGVTDVHHLKSEVVYRTRLQKISNSIHAAFNLDEILIDLKEDIVDLVGAERVTIYYVDGVKRELVSRLKSGNEVSEIRVPVSGGSIAGYAAAHQKILNIKDVYDKKELEGIDPELHFDGSWDRKTGFKTRQVLVSPIIFKSFILGVIQLINAKKAEGFTRKDEQNLAELSNIMGIALYNQKKMAGSRKSKFAYLLENHILTQKELNRAIATARQKKLPIEEILMEELNISDKEIGEALSRYYELPLIRYSENITIPGELMVGLKVSFMRKNVWVPVRSEDGEVVIAIDNPENITRVDEIRALFPGRRIKLGYATRRDISKIIDLFTTD
jgi:hypothetical protein